MSERKSAEELVKAFEEADKIVRPFREAINERLREISDFYKSFLRAHNFLDIPKYSWLGENYISIVLGSHDDKGLYFEFGYDDYYLSFDEMDNFESIIAAEYETYVAAQAIYVENVKAARRAKLEKELAELG